MLWTRPRSFPPPLRHQGPVNVRKARKIAGFRAQQTPQVAQTSEQDKFFSQLKHSSDGFSVVTQYAGRGWLSSELRPGEPGE